MFSIVRYGNVMGSRGSIIPLFVEQAKEGVISITDERMTRFMISLEQGVELVWHAFEDMVGGEIYVKKIPSMKVVDIARAISETAIHECIGIRPGEKLHEQMIGVEDAASTFEYEGHYKILPQIINWHNRGDMVGNGRPVAESFAYTSDANAEWMSDAELLQWIAENKDKVGKI